MCLPSPRAQATAAPPTLSLEKFSLNFPTDHCTNLLTFPLGGGVPLSSGGKGRANSQDKGLRETRIWIQKEFLKCYGWKLTPLPVLPPVPLPR